MGTLDFELTTQPHVTLASAAAEQDDINVIDLTATQPNEVAALDFNLDAMTSNSQGATSAFGTSIEPMVDLEKTDAGGSLVNFDFELGDTRHGRTARAPRVSIFPTSVSTCRQVSKRRPRRTKKHSLERKRRIPSSNLPVPTRKWVIERARENCLSEVLKEGTSEQQSKARDLLVQARLNDPAGTVPARVDFVTGPA